MTVAIQNRRRMAVSAFDHHIGTQIDIRASTIPNCISFKHAFCIVTRSTSPS